MQGLPHFLAATQLPMHEILLERGVRKPLRTKEENDQYQALRRSEKEQREKRQLKEGEAIPASEEGTDNSEVPPWRATR